MITLAEIDRFCHLEDDVLQWNTCFTEHHANPLQQIARVEIRGGEIDSDMLKR
jgi:hypothetical protein